MPTKTHTVPEKRLFSIKESAKYLGCGTLTVRELIYAKRLKTVKYGTKKQYIDLNDLDKFVEEHKG